ncbi:peptidoglycan-binding protein [Neotabrizicola sp. VNH66]|uniref:peptidoglycan-binding protein n=1 Tax=Neotabrizicola sp. VNH66 TaxID=3400918 RepID=UPI003BFC1C3C
MSIHPAIRAVQLGLRSLGHDPGVIDGWWGLRTATAAQRLYRGGPAAQTVWAVTQLQSGLADLGHRPGRVDGVYGAQTRAALHRLITAGGAPAASQVEVGPPPADTAVALPVTAGGPRLYQGAARYLVQSVMLHTSATSTTWWRGKTNAQMLEEIRSWHTTPEAQGGRGWRDIGYHRVAFPDGEVLEGRPLTEIGAGAVDHNRGWIHICMVPVVTIERMGLPEDYYTPETLAAARSQIARIAALTPITRLSGHNEVAAKLCPGFRVIDADWTNLNVT